MEMTRKFAANSRFTYGKTLLKMINDCELGGKAALSPSDWRTMVLIMRQCAAGGGFGMHCWPNRTAAVSAGCGARLAEPWPPSPHNSHLRELSAASECMCCFFIYKPFMQHKSRLPPSPIGHSGLFLISVLAWICCHVAHIPLSTIQRTLAAPAPQQQQSPFKHRIKFNFSEMAKKKYKINVAIILINFSVVIFYVLQMQLCTVRQGD